MNLAYSRVSFPLSIDVMAPKLPNNTKINTKMKKNFMM